ncbi:multiple sugar transport system substrate-binding protein [Nonomuraea solani]|uniref:Multiple sugar transport system substrate-binding protein n=1 Tax=Nonomuraea solani TaxID=1144553 RepID=A0A1H6EUH7_9ACTN|nr:extracellular solute-binding protein [Nonomuraea solani]SEH00706.1 multiple sugar transport system substrate-binding protein [Nonomuraea solani]
MTAMTRRGFLAAAGTLAVATATGACGSGGSGGGVGGAGNSLTWWDHQNQLQKAKAEIFATFAKSPGGVPVQYNYYNPAKMGQALQLAKQSGQLPDVRTNAGLNLPAAALVAAGWSQPLELTDEAKARVQDSLIEGLHIFDGKIHAFPIFSHQTYSSVTWFNTELVSRAGLDPEAPPKTYDEFRAAARKVQSSAGGGTYGWVWNIGMPNRLGEQVNDLAQAGGFAGFAGVLYRNGEFAFHADEYLNVIEFLVSLRQDKVLVPGANSWLDDVARARWTAGIAAYYFDGPWCPGVALKDTAAFGEKLGVGPILMPEAGAAVATYHAPQAGDYWLSSASKKAAVASRLLSEHFTTEEYSRTVAGTMSQPPRDISVVGDSQAHPAYKKLVGWFKESVFLAPEPIAGNKDIGQVQIEMKPVTPTLGDIVQGALTGDVTDVRAALTKLSSDSAKQRDAAIAAAKQKGAQVGQDDFAFPNWKPRSDYLKPMYAKR